MNRLFTKLSFIGLMALGLTACDKAIETKASTAAESITIINPHIRAMPPGQKSHCYVHAVKKHLCE